VGPKKKLSDVRMKQVSGFLTGRGGPITANWHCKYGALRGFYRYAISRGYARTAPLPKAIPKHPPPLVPYIYSVKELRSLLDACLTYERTPHVLDPHTLRTLLLLLYGAGLRVGEAVRLTRADVDLAQSLITIRGTKFQKTRLGPVGPHLTKALSRYVRYCQRDNRPQGPEAPFFTGRNGKCLCRSTVSNSFIGIRKRAGIFRTDGGRYQPRIHDLRHAFAVHRLTAWYKEGADVQKWLPVLSVYLGHARLAATSVYLTMTPALLEEAGRRFENYAFKEVCHD
jgi:integrase